MKHGLDIIKGQPSSLPHKHKDFPLWIGSKWVPAEIFQIFKSLSEDEFLELGARKKTGNAPKLNVLEKPNLCKLCQLWSNKPDLIRATL